LQGAKKTLQKNKETKLCVIKQREGKMQIHFSMKERLKLKTDLSH